MLVRLKCIVLRGMRITFKVIASNNLMNESVKFRN